MATKIEKKEKATRTAAAPKAAKTAAKKKPAVAQELGAGSAASSRKKKTAVHPATVEKKKPALRAVKKAPAPEAKIAKAVKAVPAVETPAVSKARPVEKAKKHPEASVVPAASALPPKEAAKKPAAPSVRAAVAPKTVPAAVRPHPAAPKVQPAIVPVEVPLAAPVTPVQPPEAVPSTVPPAEMPSTEPAGPRRSVTINELTTIRELSEKMGVKAVDVLKKLLAMGSMATINQRVDTDTASLLAVEFGFDAVFETLYSDQSLETEADDPAQLRPRSPVVTIMGHVDHGKTSLLDAVRSSRVAEGEAGGITQHIGAYKVETPKGTITFLDTPGHEAFTAMRSRGARATDIVVLVVSASDGVMPQTVEAIDHARAAEVPIIVAINKIDLPTANANQVKQELSKYNLVGEEWGGDTIMVEVSAKKRLHIDTLLEMILLKAEMLELKANPQASARGVVVEAKLDARRGSVATVLVQRGTLRIGDTIVVGVTYGKIRAMLNDHGIRLIEAGPGTPVEVLGMNTPPQAGDQFVSVPESQARDIAQARQSRAQAEARRPRHHLTLEDISMKKDKNLRLVLKTDVQGSLGALSDALERLSGSGINLHIIHSGAGSINESDVTLAAASDALIIGFNVRPDAAVSKLADHEGVSIRVYRIIYELIADVKAAMEGLLEPHMKETIIGKAVIKQVLKLSSSGTIAGSSVLEGRMQRGAKARLVRDNIIVYEGSISSLRRFKDDVREVEKGFECGLGLHEFSDIKTGDIVEAFLQEKVTRTL